MHPTTLSRDFLPGLRPPSTAALWHLLTGMLHDLAGLLWHNAGAGQRPLRTEVIRSTLLDDSSRLLQWHETHCIELPWDGAECLI